MSAESAKKKRTVDVVGRRFGRPTTSVTRLRYLMQIPKGMIGVLPLAALQSIPRQ